MYEDQEARKTFVNRYFDFWIYFNPGRAIPPGLTNTGKQYYHDLAESEVSFQNFSRICGEIEKGFSELPYSFSLPAYVLDWIRMETDEQDKKRREAASIDEINSRRPITLPAYGFPIDTSNNPAVKEAVEKLKRVRLSGWVNLLERINAKRLAGKAVDYEYNCAACQDTGWVNVNGSAATCVCHKGQRIRGKDGKSIEMGWDKNKRLVIAEATPEQCRMAANLNCDTTVSQPAPVGVEGIPF